MSTGFLWDERYAWHDTGTGSGFMSAGGLVEPEMHGESPATKRRFRNLLEVTGLLDQCVQLRARPATDEEILRLHAPEYVQRIKDLSAAGGGDGGELAPFGANGFEVAALAAGGAMTATEAVMRGDVDNAYALVRPPGHHAERDLGRGFCIFGNTALAALHAREDARRGARRGRRLGRPPRQRHGARVLRRPDRPGDLPAPGQPVPGRLRPGQRHR